MAMQMNREFDEKYRYLGSQEYNVLTKLQDSIIITCKKTKYIKSKCKCESSS